jgi:F-type H+-transporting ATPase subunit b
MSVLGIIATTGHFVSEEFGIDADGNVTTHHWLLPEMAEIIYGGLASLIIFGALWKFGGPMIKKSFAARTEKIQKELDAAAADKAAAATEAAGIRTAKGDIAAERQRLLAEAESQAAAVLEDGRARLAVEVAEVEAKAASDIVSAQGRVGDELRAEIARLSSAAVDHVVTGSLDDATQQELIENFIARVGASA